MRKKLIKVTVWFFIWMAVFTILSRAAYRAGIAEVTAEKPTAETFQPNISAEGIVTGRQEVAVGTEANHKIQTVYVKAGQTVNAGEILYELDLAELEKEISDKTRELQMTDLQIQSAQSSAQAAEAGRQLSASQAAGDYERAVNRGAEEVSQAQQELERAQQAYDNYIADPEAYPEQTAEALAAEIEEKKQAYDQSVENYNNSVYEAQKALDQSSVASPVDTSVEQLQLTRQTQQEALDKLNALYSTEGKVTAPVSGRVTAVTIQAGSMTTGSGDILMTDASEGTRLSVTFSSDQREFLAEGNQVLVTLTGSEAGVNKTPKRTMIKSVADSEALEQIVGNPADTDGSTENGQSAQGSITVVVDLPSDTFPVGSTAKLEVETQGTYYDVCIPASALHIQQQEQYYVYVVEERSSVLGTEWIVRHVDVELLDKNESLAAVQGLSSEQEVLTESSRTVEDGSRVKRADQ